MRQAGNYWRRGIRCLQIFVDNQPIVRVQAFDECGLTDVIFGNKLERIEGNVFVFCDCLERITIPLKDGMTINDNVFRGCEKLQYVDLVEGSLHETMTALHFEEWRNDMYGEIDSINQILPNAPAGG